MLEQYCLNYGYSLETINKMRASYALHYYKDGLLLSKIESINSTSLKDIKAYFKIHPKWKTFEQIAGL